MKTVPGARFIRAALAPSYLGMDAGRFRREVKPHVYAIKIGIRGVAYERESLDRWADAYMEKQGLKSWRQEEQQGSSVVRTSQAASGTSINGSRVTDEFAKALARVTSKKPKRSSRAA